MDLLKPYLPKNEGNPNYYAYGGSLYALGFIHSTTKDQEIINYMITCIKDPGHKDNE